MPEKSGTDKSSLRLHPRLWLFVRVDTLGSRLSSTRQARGLSVRELAKVAGVAPQTIADAEQGRHEPSLPVLRRLAAALAVSACWLAVLDEEALPSEPT